MFQQLEALVQASGKLQLTLKMDNDRMAVVVVPQGEGKDAALRQPLVLTGTAAELDEGFAAAISSYSTAHASLSEQVAATTAILQEAEKNQASKAQKSLAKGGRAVPAKAGPSATSSGDEGEGEDDNDDDYTSPSASAAPAASASPASSGTSSGTDLLSLLA
ncbi:PRTRC system protein E (plasmid) [Paraburkholderia sprentiae WSM5005]|uniref:PRTRC system protein E n=1 Tax=Paraburkholderia sprentiae WSM5005 TaxID=754502 RepID=A0A1I9YWU4_9BURK|nr:PRTRC system protein E [Paraburkholderia sprentiae]APA90631.1 PRTRC system protein E [Paraburkholderia sprentiae WSM5005]